MKKHLKTIIVLALIAFAMLSACTNENQLTVYRVSDLKGSKLIEVIKGDNVRLKIKEGDTVAVNLDDSEITSLKREDGAILPQMEYNYIVKSIYQSTKY